MAMRIRRYNAEHIAQYSRSRATLDAIIHRHWLSICPILPWQTSWSLILAQKIELWRCETAVLKLAFKVTKQTLYSAHRSNKLRRNVESHGSSRRDQLSFQPSNIDNGQKLVKLPITMKLVKKLALTSANSLSC